MYTYLHKHLILYIRYYKVICYQGKLARSLKIILEVIISLIYKMLLLFKNRHHLLHIKQIFLKIYLLILTIKY